LLQVEGLTVELAARGRRIRPVDQLDLAVATGETFALVGESGCGKSMTALALARLLPVNGVIRGGSVRLAGTELMELPEARMREVRGGGLGMIFQEPSTSLNPVMSVYHQIAEVLALHRGLSGAAARAEAARLLDAVGIPDAQRRLDSYPFQLSGGMRQRVMIAIALAGQPRLLIADEPTTALDVTIQAQVLDLLAGLQAERGMGMLLITHDLGVVARMAQRVGVMYAGQLVETGERDAFFDNPLHPYSRKLFGALPRGAMRGRMLEALPGSVPALDREFTGCRFADRCSHAMAHCADVLPEWHGVGAQRVRCHLYAPAASGPGVYRARTHSELRAAAQPPQRDQRALLEVQDLQVHFPVRKGVLQRVAGWVKAVDGVDFSVHAGRTVALVGESGCGKTTIGKAILQLERPTAGGVFFEGDDLAAMDEASLRPRRKGLQMVFQDPFASLDPRMRIGEIIEEGMQALGVGGNAQGRRVIVEGLLERVGLDPVMRERYPHEFSGGQRQRIAIARALAVSPRLIVCDEPTSALDVSVQAQILNLLAELQAELGISYLFITHNLAVVDHLADEVLVMYLGRVVERGPTRRVLAHPAHPYTRALLAAVPRLPDEIEDDAAAAGAAGAGRGGEMPSPLAPPAGCHYHPRCERATDICRQKYPPGTGLTGSHRVHCHWPLG
jgi:peptide/nickel transport system ATP-binding protein